MVSVVLSYNFKQWFVCLYFFSQHLLAQGQQKKHQNNVRSMFKVINIDTERHPMFDNCSKKSVRLLVCAH